MGRTQWGMNHGTEKHGTEKNERRGRDRAGTAVRAMGRNGSGSGSVNTAPPAGPVKKGPERRGAFQARAGEFTENGERAPMSIFHLSRGGFCAIAHRSRMIRGGPAQGIDVVELSVRFIVKSAFLP